jgi:hypothetical protein
MPYTVEMQAVDIALFEQIGASAHFQPLKVELEQQNPYYKNICVAA